MPLRFGPGTAVVTPPRDWPNWFGNSTCTKNRFKRAAGATEDWAPAALVISAGFDSMAGDPLGGFTLEPGHYAELVTGLRERLGPVPVVSLLEGGYAPRRVADGALAHVEALAG